MEAAHNPHDFGFIENLEIIPLSHEVLAGLTGNLSASPRDTSAPAGCSTCNCSSLEAGIDPEP
jgi:hypothetical protein